LGDNAPLVSAATTNAYYAAAMAGLMASIVKSLGELGLPLPVTLKGALGMLTPAKE
jgi:phage-related holin